MLHCTRVIEEASKLFDNFACLWTRARRILQSIFTKSDVHLASLFVGTDSLSSLDRLAFEEPGGTLGSDSEVFQASTVVDESKVENFSERRTRNVPPPS